MKTKARVPSPGIALSRILQGLAAVALAQGAIAAPPALPHEGGLLTLSNVRIESASTRQLADVARAAPAAQAGVRGYKDKQSGRLREQTPEEMISEAAESAAAFAPSFGAKSMFTPAGGGIAIELDDTFMTNAVASRDASGRLRMQCATGEAPTQDRLLKVGARKEHRHDH